MTKKGKKGKGHKGRRGKKKGARRGRKSPGAAVEAGALGTVYNFGWRNPTGGSGIVPWTFANKKLLPAKDMVTITKANALDWDTYFPFIAGVLVHWGKNKPILNIVGRPLDKMSKKYLHRPL